MWSPCGFNTYRNSHLTFLECNLYRIRKNMAAFFQKKKKKPQVVCDIAPHPHSLFELNCNTRPNLWSCVALFCHGEDG